MIAAPIILVGVLAALPGRGAPHPARSTSAASCSGSGRFAGVKEAGLRWIIPGVDRMVRISLREIVMDVPPQEVITRDNVSVKVNAVLYFRVLHPEKAVIQVENYLYGTSQLAQTTLRSVCGQAELDELLAERERINQQLQEIIDQQTEPWGVKVRAVEVKQHRPAAGDAARDGEAGRGRAREARQGDPRRGRVRRRRSGSPRRRASCRTEPAALQLRYLQTLAEIATEKNSTILFPIPIDLLRPLYWRASAPRRRPSKSGAAS